MTETPNKPRIAIGSDHAGFLVKETIRKYLQAAGYAVDDQGTSSEESVDYPDFGKAVGKRVASKQADLGIAVCGSGIGISIAANKVPGIRAALAHDVITARLAREHNDANVLALGGRIVTPEAALEMVQTFLTTAYLGGRDHAALTKSPKSSAIRICSGAIFRLSSLRALSSLCTLRKSLLSLPAVGLSRHPP
jgi:ribose 5-phosphate isomerase B